VIGPTCVKCRRVHVAGSVVAVDRFRPEGPVGYQFDGRIYATRGAAEAELCRSLTVSDPDSSESAADVTTDVGPTPPIPHSQEQQ